MTTTEKPRPAATGRGTTDTDANGHLHTPLYQSLTGRQLAEDLVPGSAEWLKAVTASKVPTMLGLTPSHWDTAYSLWHKMAGIVPVEEKSSDAQERGHEFEPMIRDWVQDAHPDWWVAETGTWQHHERVDHFANPDGLICHGDGSVSALEVKTAQDFHLWQGEVPANYLVQGIWQAYVTGADSVTFAVCGPFELFDRKPWIETVPAQPALVDSIVRRVDQFMQSIADNRPPARIDAADPTVEALRWRNPTVRPVPVQVPDEIGERFVAAYRTEWETEGLVAEARADLMEFMGDAKEAEYDGQVIATRTNRKNSAPILRRAKGLDILTGKAQTNE